MNVGRKMRQTMTGVMAMAVAVFMTALGYAQPVRHSRNRVVAPVAAANAQTAQPGPQCAADDANVARQHRRAAAEAFDAHDWSTCSAEYQVAQSRCPTPEAALNLGTCLESQGLLPQALEQYEALQRSGQLVADFTGTQLQRLIDNVRSRLPRTPVTITVVAPPVAACTANVQIDPTNCGACGNRCGGAEQCSAGRCVAIVGMRPVVVQPPSRSHALPIALMATGGAVAAGGTILAVITGNDAETTCDEQGRITGCNMVASGPHPRTVSTAGWVAAGVGGAVAIVGLVLELLPQRRGTTPPRGATAHLTGGVDRDGNPFLGLGGNF